MRTYQLISTKDSKEKISLPINPASFELSYMQLNQKIILLNAGEVNQLGGKGLATGVISSFFPASNSPFYRKANKLPVEYISLLQKWKDATVPIRLIVSEVNINIVMVIDKLSQITNEGDKDIYYTIELSEHKTLNVPAVKVSTKTTVKRPATKSPKTKTQAKTYTTKSSDTLWAIAVKYYGSGSKYTKIYDANKSLIETTAKKHGFKSSDKGHWIWGRMKLVIP